MAESLIDSAFAWVDAAFRGYYAAIIAAAIIVLAGFIVGKLAGRIVERTLHAMETDALLRKATQSEARVEHALGRISAWLIYAVAIVMALNQLGVTTAILQMLVAGVIIVFIIAVALAVKDFIPNATAGLYILKNKVVVPGQVVRLKGVQGKVVAVTLLETRLRTKEGDMVHVPNSSITRSEVVTVGWREKR